VQIWQAIILGVVEGITEYLPISSTGHLILAKAALGLDETPEMTKAVDEFLIVIQGGAILAVLGLYWRRAWQMLLGLCGRNAKGLRLLLNLFVAFLPAAVLGLLLKSWIESKLFSTGPVVLALLVGGVFMMLVEAKRDGRIGGKSALPRRLADLKDIDDLSPGDAIVVGFLQCISMWPGTSRSMMTIVGGYLVGLKPKAAAEFSFLLGLPTLGAATLYTIYKNFKHSAEHGTPNLFQVIGWQTALIGMAVAAISAALAVKWLVAFLNRKGLIPFGWYRIVLGSYSPRSSGAASSPPSAAPPSRAPALKSSSRSSSTHCPPSPSHDAKALLFSSLSQSSGGFRVFGARLGLTL
jgi:undecaprenyl-diphosphatase